MEFITHLVLFVLFCGFSCGALLLLIFSLFIKLGLINVKQGCVTEDDKIEWHNLDYRVNELIIISLLFLILFGGITYAIM